MPQPDTLTLKPSSRRGGSAKTARDYLDFIISGETLRHRLGPSAHDLIGCLGWGVPEYQQTVVQQLLLERPSDLRSGRHMIYVCPECGDIGCGAITAAISRDGDHIVWRDFGYENAYDGVIHERDQLALVGPFYFEAAAYNRVLRSDSRVFTPTA